MDKVIKNRSRSPLRSNPKLIKTTKLASLSGRKLSPNPTRSETIGSDNGARLSKNEAEVTSVKCVLVGDANIGKTSLIHSFLFDDFSKEYVATARDDYTFCTTMGIQGEARKVDVDLEIVDTGGQTYLDRLRPLCYNMGPMMTSSTDVIFICFSVVIPSSFANVTRRWIPELKRHCLNFNKSVKTILVGTQSDLRSNVNILLQLMDDGLSPISEARAMRLAKKIGALNYIECSSLTHYNIKRLFESAMMACKRPSCHQNVTLPSKVLCPKLELSSSRSSSPSTKSASTPGKRESKTKIPLKSSNSNGGIGDRKLFWRKWRLQQKSNKIKRIMFSCLH